MNWKLVIADLESAGLTQTEIAEKAGCSQPYISQLKSGARTRPDFDRGNALALLHRKHAKNRPEKAA